MVRNRISDKAKRRFKNTTQSFIKGLSRSVIVNKLPKRRLCDNCYYDKFTESSTGKCKWTVEEAQQKQDEWELTHPGELKYKWFLRGRCPICKGRGYLEVNRSTTVDCKIRWSPDNRYGNEMEYTIAGYEGSTTVELKTEPEYLNLFKTAKDFVVDGVECKLLKPPYIRGLGNHAVLVVYVFTSDKPNKNSGEDIKDYS
jgi:hypothetical protein